jgi:ABC-type branched-subunit amino acid transport system substrate-binding protein
MVDAMGANGLAYDRPSPHEPSPKGEVVILKSWGAALIAAGLLVGTLSACSSGKSTSKSSASSSGAGSSSAAPSGKPIEINITYPKTGAFVYAEMGTAVAAAEKAVNDSGGIKGRPLKVDVCDTTSPVDPNPTQACLRGVVANQDVVAEVADYSSFNDITTPLENSNGMAQIGGIPLGLSQLTLPNSFPLVMPEEEAMGATMVANGSKKPSLIYINIPTAQKAPSQINAWLKAGGSTAQLVSAVPSDITSTDLSPQVAATCSAGADATSLSLSYTGVAAFLTARQQGSCPNIKVVATALGQANTTASLGAKAEGMIVTSGMPLWTNTSLQGIKMFNDQMNAIDSKSVKDEESLNAWAAVWAFAQEARKMSNDVTRANVLAYWKKLGAFQLFDLFPPGMSFQTPAVVDGNKVYNHWTQIGIVKSGQITDSGQGWVDLTKLK